ncbi:unnamed protein product [Leuciscus chuanchicus]
MNEASTRSHCIFTIHLCSKELGSATVRCSKLHLVDLAGSERVGKTGVGGQILTEAKYINLSLHYLEQVIIALSEKHRSHIPYRNSMMTSVLRDSLGGNCMTTMIATVSVERRNIAESMSTCRFAQRVALIKNDALLNEELDPALLIVRLKKEIQSLKEELALVTGEQRSDKLNQEEIQQLEEQVNVYLEDPDNEVTLDLGPDMRKIHFCFFLLKVKMRERLSAQNGVSNGSSPPLKGMSDGEDRNSHAELQKLRDTVTHRDNEISILVSMLKREKRKVQDVTSQLAQLHNQNPSTCSSSRSPTSLQVEESEKCDTSIDYTHAHHLITRKRVPELSVGKQAAFEVFLKDHEDRLTIEDNRAVLQQRFVEAKTLGEQVNQIRIRVNELKIQLKIRRKQMAAQVLTGNQTESESDSAEERILNQIEEQKKKCGHSAENTGSSLSHVSPLSCMLTRNNHPKGDDTDPQERRQRERDMRQRALPSADLSFTSIPLTGDKQTDAEIQAFIRARHNLLNSTALALADGDCPHCELVTAYGDSEDSPGILLRDCSSAPPPPTRKACRFARLPCLLGGRYLFSLCSSRAHRAAHRGCQERAVTGLAFSLPLFKPRKLRRSQGRLEADGRG